MGLSEQQKDQHVSDFLKDAFQADGQCLYQGVVVINSRKSKLYELHDSGRGIISVTIGRGERLKVGSEYCDGITLEIIKQIRNLLFDGQDAEALSELEELVKMIEEEPSKIKYTLNGKDIEAPEIAKEIEVEMDYNEEQVKVIKKWIDSDSLEVKPEPHPTNPFLVKGESVGSTEQRTRE